MATKYIPFEEAARALEVGRDELIRMVSYGTIRAFRIENEMKFRQKDIQGLSRIKKLLAAAALRQSTDGEDAPDPELWQRFQKGELIDFEALREVEEEEAFDPTDSVGESVFTEALASRVGSVDAVVEEMEEEPAPAPARKKPAPTPPRPEPAQKAETARKPARPSTSSAPRPPPPRRKPPAVVDRETAREIAQIASQVAGGREEEDEAPPPPTPGPEDVEREEEEPAARRRAPVEPAELDEEELEAGSPARKALVALVFVVVFAGILVWRLRFAGREEELPEVLAGQVRRMDLHQVVAGRGVLKAHQEMEVTAGERGKLASLEIKADQRVIKDETIIARIQARHLEDELQVARSEKEAKDLALKEAQVGLENAKNLIAKEKAQIRDGADQQARQAQDALDRALTRHGQAAKLVETLADELQRVEALSKGSESEVRITKLRTDLRYAREELSRAVKERDESKKELEDARKLRDPAHPAHKTRLAPLDDNLRKAELSIQRIQQEIELAARRLLQATHRLQDTVVRAPISGVVSELKVNLGDQVAATSVLAVISDRSKMVVEVPIDETDYFKLRPGRKARIQLESFPDREFSGEVVHIGTQGQKKSGTDISYVPVKVLVEGKVAGLNPGLTAFVEINVKSASGALAVPIEALVKKQGGGKGDRMEAVLALRMEGETMVVRPVEVGRGLSDNRHVELEFAGDLREGTPIVVGPYRLLEKLREGDRVRVIRPGGGPAGEK